ncbi:MAG: RNA polymerase-associated protein RapA [Pseudomonadales bacterium]|nr:RNA polymerase-associated protein RapA [Pseudomonadales bacterium]
MFAVGQRWISDTELELGLGMIEEIDGRQVSIYFPATDETRRYATANAPLTRVKFKIGDQIQIQSSDDEEGVTEVTVTDLREQNDVVFYDDGTHWIPETSLSGLIQLNQAADRLFSGQLDKLKAYDLRLAALQKHSELNANQQYGLAGARAQLLPHQLYIAQQVSQREAPRVLLADEVGLGKTIEAGLILHRLLLLGRIERVLILLPDNLIHQWLIEMLRRFNLAFSVMDEERCLTFEIENPEGNPFQQQRLVLGSLDALANNGERAAQLVEATWDLVIVDEAHHLQWSQNSNEVGNSYRLVETLAALTPGLLLLTATPEQLGIEGHFARLRLLDPERFHNLEAFIKEEQSYQPVAEAARSLLQQQPLTDTQITQLDSWLDEPACAEPTEPQRKQWLQQLIDRHGTGRVLFRNTRSAIKGFPRRRFVEWPLALPQAYQNLTADNVDSSAVADYPAGLYPERVVADWVSHDPRIDWLIELLKQYKGEKVLLICHQAATVLELSEQLRQREGLHCSVFHEGLTIVERDRSAAYFSDAEYGSQLMLCSEIGSEGRNFQFSHHLVMFDLPLNCDLVEQRIGRLDRIGQQHEIQIHVPYFEGHGSEALAKIYHQGLDLFESTRASAQGLFEKYIDQIKTQISGFTAREGNVNTEELQELIKQLVPERQALDQILEQGRDWLLERNSCDELQAAQIVEALQLNDEKNAQNLQPFIDKICDLYGIEQDYHSAECHILRPGDHMVYPQFPHLPEEGLTYTCNREIAVSRDEIQFFSWEHPLICGALELLLNEPLGNSCVAYLENHRYKTGQFYLQAQFTVSCQAPRQLQLQRYLSSAGLYISCLPDGTLGRGIIESLGELQNIDKKTAVLLIENMRAGIQQKLQQVELAGQAELPQLLEKALHNVDQEHNTEIRRLQELKKRNPNIRQQEIDSLHEKQRQLRQHIEQAKLRVDSIRVIFCG